MASESDGDRRLTPDAVASAFRDMVRQHRKWFLWLGIVWIVLGTAAILLPHAAAIAVDLLVGWLLVIGGVATLVHAFQAKGWQQVALAAVSGLLYLAAGLILLVFPLEGVLTLTMMLAILFVIEGVLRCVMAFRVRPDDGWGWILASGAATVVLGLLIWGGLPTTADWAIGLLVGIQLIFGGWSMIAVANAAGKAD